jgi:hypothetical protein
MPAEFQPLDSWKPGNRRPAPSRRSGGRRDQFPSKHLAFIHSLGLVVLLGLAGCSPAGPLPSVPLGPACPTPAAKAISPPIPRPVSSRDLGALGRPAAVLTRDGGASALVGGKLLWFFGDTLLARPAADGGTYRADSAAWSMPSAPTVLQEPLDAHGAPFQFLPFTPEEDTYNQSRRDPNDRIALWPGSLLSINTTEGLAFYVKLKVTGSLRYEFMGTGLARIQAGENTAVRDAGLLFQAPEPTFDEALAAGDLVYLYGNMNNGAAGGPVALACVPRAQVAVRSAYRFWDGSGWNADVQRARPVLTGVPGSLSVAYNPYLGGYLAVHSEILSNRILMQVAASPQGPWSEPAVLYTGNTPAAGKVDYAGREHPELAAQDGRAIVISYYQPQAGFSGELRLVAVSLK